LDRIAALAWGAIRIWRSFRIRSTTARSSKQFIARESNIQIGKAGERRVTDMEPNRIIEL